MFTVPDVDEDERKLIKFATKNIPYYNPRAGYAYYEFTGQKYIIPDRNIMALSKVTFKITVCSYTIIAFTIINIIETIRKESYSRDLASVI